MTRRGQHGAVLEDLNLQAQNMGLFRGQRLTDARASAPDIQAHEASPHAEVRLVTALAIWAIRFCPWTAPEIPGKASQHVESNVKRNRSPLKRKGAESACAAPHMTGLGFWMDITGCAHLFGGEDALIQRIYTALSHMGFMVRLGLADTPGAAWAAARFMASPCRIIATATDQKTMAQLPPEALRITPEDANTLHRLGLNTVGALSKIPRAAIKRRFNLNILRRLDQIYGAEPEPIAPHIPVEIPHAKLRFADPIGLPADMQYALTEVAERLTTILSQLGVGARTLHLSIQRVDVTLPPIIRHTSRPTRDTNHMIRLLSEALETVDPGFGVDAMSLSAPHIAPIWARQGSMAIRHGSNAPIIPEPDDAAMSQLIDRLSLRLGAQHVRRLLPRHSHIPERAAYAVNCLSHDTIKATSSWPDSWQSKAARPVRLLHPPEPIDVMALLPDAPPSQFKWRRLSYRITAADGPERIASEWWRTPLVPPTNAYDLADVGDRLSNIRDYYRIEASTPHTGTVRLWVFRQGLYERRDADQAAATALDQPCWFVHGWLA